MQTLDSDGPLVPVLVYNQNNDLIASFIQNDKARLKSLEQKELWVVDGSTGRVLPQAMIGNFERVEQKDGINICRIVQTNMTKQDWDARETKDLAPKHSFGDFPFDLEATIIDRKQKMPEGSYTSHLFQKGLSKIRKKTGEEAIELVLATEPKEIVSEAADLLYHLTVLLVEQNISWKDVIVELGKR